MYLVRSLVIFSGEPAACLSPVTAKVVSTDFAGAEGPSPARPRAVAESRPTAASLHSASDPRSTGKNLAVPSTEPVDPCPSPTRHRTIARAEYSSRSPPCRRRSSPKRSRASPPPHARAQFSHHSNVGCNARTDAIPRAGSAPPAARSRSRRRRPCRFRSGTPGAFHELAVCSPFGPPFCAIKRERTPAACKSNSASPKASTASQRASTPQTASMLAIRRSGRPARSTGDRLRISACRVSREATLALCGNGGTIHEASSPRLAVVFQRHNPGKNGQTPTHSGFVETPTSLVNKAGRLHSVVALATLVIARQRVPVPGSHGALWAQ